MTHSARGLERIRDYGPGGATALMMDAQLQDLLVGRYWEYFSYGPTAGPILNVASGANGTATISIESDSDFLALAGTISVAEEATPGTLLATPPLQVQVVRSSSGNEVFSADVHANNVFGDGQRPCWYPFYRRFPANTTITLTFNNLAAAAVRIWPAFLGIRIYKEGYLT